MTAKFEYGIENRYIDVTSIVFENFHNKDTNEIIIPSNTVYFKYFTDPLVGIHKHLRVTYNNLSLLIKDDAPFRLNLNSQIPHKLVCIYFINCYMSPYYM